MGEEPARRDEMRHVLFRVELITRLEEKRS